MATLEQLEAGVRKAYEVGNMDYARILGAELVRAREDRVNQIPGMPVQQPPPPEPSMADKAIGTGEAALALGTGMTGGTVGMIGGALKHMAERILSGKFKTSDAEAFVAQKALEDAAMKGAQALTYAPRTQSGKDQAAAVGEAAQNLIPLGPLTEMGALAQGMKASAPAVAMTAERGARAAQGAGKAIVEKVMPGNKQTPGTMASGGAAAVDMATLRRAKADELPIPMGDKLTEGMATRTFEAQRFEREVAKDPELGAPVRERFSELNRSLQQNMDAFIDATGAESPDLRSIGVRVDAAMRSRAARDKLRIRALYKEAEKSGEMEAPIRLDNVISHLKESAPEAEVANVLKAARAKAIQLGIAREIDGELIALEAPLKNVELFRRSINNATNAEPTNIRQAAIMKGLVDQATEGKGGKLYEKARAARSRYARDYENVALVRNLIGQKRGSNDRAIALEDVLRRSILDPSTSLDDVRQVRRLLQTEGENGQQAWRELQGGTVRYLRDEATKNVARNELGDPIVSAAQLDRAITQLDKSGKLEFVFGKKGAEQLRTINDVAKDVLTAPPGSVNTSNTSSVLLAAMDIAISGTAGVPAPILSGLRMATKGVKNAKTRARVKKALGE